MVEDGVLDPEGPTLSTVRQFEIDRDLAALWRVRTGPSLQLHEQDALQFDFSAIAPAQGALRVVGNLPYNISTPLIFHLLEYAPVIEDMHFMLQKEVIDRMVAIVRLLRQSIAAGIAGTSWDDRVLPAQAPGFAYGGVGTL